MDIAVVGLGKIGLPLAVQYAGKGHEVRGADIAPAVIDAVRGGRPPFPGETELPERLARTVREGKLTATSHTTDAVAASDVVVVAVPLYVNAEATPDFSAIDAATQAIGGGLQRGTLVIYETTLPVGTTRQRLVPMLEQAAGIPRDELLVAFSPERVFSGRVFADLARYPKLVGGVGDAATQRALHFYNEVLDFDERDDLRFPNGVWDLGSAEAAELAKLAETTYRDVNIALANQFAQHAETLGVDIYQVIEACNSQPFSHVHAPGIAVGGHCIPVYPKLYLWGDHDAAVVRAARAVNEDMPRWAVDLLAAEHGPLAGQRVVVLGASYRGGVKETAFSGVFGVVEALHARGARPVVHDPLYEPAELQFLDLVPHLPGQEADAAIVQADHVEYRTLGAADLPGVRTVVDGRRVLDPARWEGVRLKVLGRPMGDSRAATPLIAG